MTSAVRTVLIVVGAIILVIGAIFAGQGANLIPGSSMTGSHFWLSVGLVMAVVGIVLVLVGLLSRRRPE